MSKESFLCTFAVAFGIFLGIIFGKYLLHNIKESEAEQKKEQVTQEPLLIIYDIDKHNNGLFRYRLGDGSWGCSKISVLTSERLGTIGDTLKIVKYEANN